MNTQESRRAARPRWRLLLGSAAAAIVLAGCMVTPVGPVPPGMGETKYGALQYFASASMNCPRESLAYEVFGEGRHLFKGCGETTEMLLVEGNDAKVHGYRSGFISPAASNGYAKELGCDVRRTKEERVDFRTHVVDGCGQRVTYVQVCNPHCSWLANSAMAQR